MMLARRITLILGLFTLIVGLVMVTVWFGSRRPMEQNVMQAQPAHAVAVLTAARPLAAGTLLHQEDLGWSDVAAPAPAGSLFHGRSSVEEWVGAVVRHDYPQGQPLMAVDLIKPSEAGFLPAVLEPGDKAVTIAVDPAQIMSGLILPGDRVDVLLVQSFGTQEQGLPPARRSVGETLLHDVRVIALDQRISDAPKAPAGSSGAGFTAASSQAVNVPKTVTLEVSLADAQRLLVASQLGHVSLAMRGPSPATAVPESVSPTWASDASPALLELSHGGTPKAGSGSKSFAVRPQVQVIHGTAKTERLCVTGSGGKLSSDCSSAQ